MKERYYVVPQENWQRVHFVRPRYKGDIENVLLYMAHECCKIKRCSCKEYSAKYFDAIKAYPDNIGKKEKTIQNWRTETPALFAFYIEDKDNDTTYTSAAAKFLNERQDLRLFFRQFLFSFQLPGGHLKPNENVKLIKKGIKFKPAKVLLNVLGAGNTVLSSTGKGKQMSINAEEATYCIFNDTRVTTGRREGEDIARQILSNRSKKLKYYDPNDIRLASSLGRTRSKGDVTRYAGDILDYMVLAGLLTERHGYYTLKVNDAESLNTYKVFINDETYFDGYDKFYGREEIDVSELTGIETAWFNYVDSVMSDDKLGGNSQTVDDDTPTELQELDLSLEGRIKDLIVKTNKTGKEIGNVGEAVVCGHEKMRLKLSGFPELSQRVRIIDSPAFHPGFDIFSFEGDTEGLHRYIEVKTTISRHEIKTLGFHMTPNEWEAAKTNTKHYCVYRLMISEGKRKLFILRNPVELNKKDLIDFTVGNGLEISFDSKNFSAEEVLTWED